MTKDEALTKLQAVLEDVEPGTMMTTQQLILAYHNKHGGRPAVAELCRTFEVNCKQGSEVCSSCATEGMDRAMDAMGVLFIEGNAPTSRSLQ